MLQIFLRKCEMSRETGRSRERMGKANREKVSRTIFRRPLAAFALENNSILDVKPDALAPLTRSDPENRASGISTQIFADFMSSKRFDNDKQARDFRQLIVDVIVEKLCIGLQTLEGDNARYPF